MNKKLLFYTVIILFPFFRSQKAVAQDGIRRQRQVTVNQTIIDGKVISSDTLIFETDTMRQRPVQSKEISMELPYTKGTTLYIENTYRKLNIRQSKDSKVRLSTSAFYYGEPAFTNEQWFEKLNIGAKTTDTGISIISGSINRSNATSPWSSSYWSYGSGVQDAPTPPPTPVATSPTGVQNTRTANGTNIYSRATTNGAFTTGNWISSGDVVAVFDEKGNTFYNSTSLKRELTIYVPAGIKLNVTSKYANVSVDHDVSSIKANISNASLDMLNATDAVIRSTYGTVSTTNLTNADISSTSGKVFVKDVARLQLNTRYTKVEAGSCGSLKIHSISDDYDLDEVKNLSGEKTYGSLRVNKLTGTFDLKGSSADVKIRNIDPSVSNVTIDNKYAEVRLPVTSLKNYEVIFSGQYSSIFAPFERQEDTTAQSSVVQGYERTGNDNIRYTATSGTSVSATKPSFPLHNRTGNFIANIGDTKGIHTIFKLVCNSCNVDFK